MEPLDQHSCPLISRWRARWLLAAAGALWAALSDPSPFAAERRMLPGIKARAEQATFLPAPIMAAGVVLEVAWGINDKGQIAGTALVGGHGHGYLLTPAR